MVSSSIDQPQIQRLVIALSLVLALAAGLSWWSAQPPQQQQQAAPPAAAVQAGGAGRAGAEPPLLQVDINRAEFAELCLLPNIGPVAARRIVAERSAGGEYESLEDVAQRVRGIGPKTIERCRPYLIVP